MVSGEGEIVELKSWVNTRSIPDIENMLGDFEKKMRATL